MDLELAFEVALGAFMDVHGVYSICDAFEGPWGNWYQWVADRKTGQNGLVVYEIDAERGVLISAEMLAEVAS
tara:strand:- start:3505 stop:3720 length:216 start_codon:yes stop_codon:yes gene_type:complete